MSFYPKKNTVNTVQQLDALVNNVNNTGLRLYKLDVNGPKYEGYIQNCNGIKEVLVYKKPVKGPYLYFENFYYCEILKTKTSTVKKEFPNSHSYFFLTRQDAENAFKDIQKESVITLERRLDYYQDLLDNVKQMSV